ncbi:MAG: molybdenum cofactor guanylyltransferase MobA [Rhodovibrionaceae bacterium]|nr:molybdenum cofactor guanylyltransferase MobA [Rhodovibrionaceae bacterium]
MTRRDDHRPQVCGVLLAGGLARRMGGGDKCLRPLAGRPILSHIIERLRPQVDGMVLNANGDPARFAGFDLAVVADVVEGHAGPLAGVLTGMDWAARHMPSCDWIVTVPTDAPFLPRDLVLRFEEAVERESAKMACAASGGRNHPVVGLWPVALREELRRAMVDEDIRKVDVWTARYTLAVVDWPTEPVDPFFNTNRPEDLEAAEKMLAAHRKAVS